MFLLDSNALVWWIMQPELLSAPTFDIIKNSRKPFYVSMASLWELEIKQKLGKLDLTPDFWPSVDLEGFTLIPIDRNDALTAARFPLHHADPFDRMIIAQAFKRNLTILTRDRHFSLYGVPVISA